MTLEETLERARDDQKAHKIRCIRSVGTQVGCKSVNNGMRGDMENREATLERSERHTAPAKKSYRMAKIDLIAEQSPKTISKSGATDADE